MSRRIEHEMAERWPERHAKTAKSKAMAIKMACAACMGGGWIDAVRCEDRTCYLHRHAWRRERGYQAED